MSIWNSFSIYFGFRFLSIYNRKIIDYCINFTIVLHSFAWNLFSRWVWLQDYLNPEKSRYCPFSSSWIVCHWRRIDWNSKSRKSPRENDEFWKRSDKWSRILISTLKMKWKISEKKRSVWTLRRSWCVARKWRIADRIMCKPWGFVFIWKLSI